MLSLSVALTMYYLPNDLEGEEDEREEGGGRRKGTTWSPINVSNIPTPK